MVREEEERFGVTLDKGLAILAEELDRLEGAGEKLISGEFAFKLYDTYGFPLDIVNDVAGKRGISTDEAGYRVCMGVRTTDFSLSQNQVNSLLQSGTNNTDAYLAWFTDQANAPLNRI